MLNPLTAGPEYLRVFIFYQHIEYQFLKMLRIKRDFKIVDLQFVKCE